MGLGRILKRYGRAHERFVKNPNGRTFEDMTRVALDPGDRFGLTDPPDPNSKTPYADMLGKITESQQAYYDKEYRPIAQGLIKDTQSTAMVDAAKVAAGEDSTNVNAARQTRQLLRRGIGVSGSDGALAAYTAAESRAKTNDGNVNQSRIQQDARNTALTSDLVAVSRGIAQNALDGMATSSSAESNRNATNANISTQNKVARNQTGATAASLALMALLAW